MLEACAAPKSLASCSWDIACRSLDDCQYAGFQKVVVPFVGVLIIRALLVGVYIRVPDFGKLPYCGPIIPNRAIV